MKTMVISPHPDDEVLGVGGTLLRRKEEGAIVAWVIVTDISVEAGWSKERVNQRQNEIKQITELFRFDEVYSFAYPTTSLDQVSVSDMVKKISHVFKEFEPEEVFIPHPSDVHTDHRVVYDAAVSCTKWFRYPSIKTVLAYETLSETDFGYATELGFRPNVFVNIEPYIDDKLKAMEIYKSEMGELPFPRSREAIKAQAILRGVASGFKSAEAFELLRQRI